MRPSVLLLLSLLWLGLCLPSPAASGRVMKVLPHFLDRDGRHTISPSLYDRDAYQKVLREQPERRSGMRFDIQWKTKGAAFEPLTLRLEVRGTARGALPAHRWIDIAVTPGGDVLGKWTGIKLTDAVYKDVGQVTAWRVTLWEGNRVIAEQTSFLW